MGQVTAGTRGAGSSLPVQPEGQALVRKGPAEMLEAVNRRDFFYKNICLLYIYIYTGYIYIYIYLHIYMYTF